MDSAEIFQPPLLLNKSQDNTVYGALTYPLPASVFQKDTTRSRVIQENYGTDQILRGGRLLDGSFIFRTHLPNSVVRTRQRGRELAMKLS